MWPSWSVWVAPWKGCHLGMPMFYREILTLTRVVSERPCGAWLEGMSCVIWTWVVLCFWISLFCFLFFLKENLRNISTQNTRNFKSEPLLNYFANWGQRLHIPHYYFIISITFIHFCEIKILFICLWSYFTSLFIMVHEPSITTEYKNQLILLNTAAGEFCFSMNPNSCFTARESLWI